MISKSSIREGPKGTWLTHSADTSVEMRYTSIRSHFEEEIEKVPQIEEINQIIASEEKMSRLRDETDKYET